MARRVLLQLTDSEAAALAALVAGAGALVGRVVDAESALVAAIDLGLTRLVEDFEVPDAAVRERVVQAREALRQNWSRGHVEL